MKISKLFHWLYAILMLLPVAMFIPTAFYYGFNEQAQAQEKIINNEETINLSQKYDYMNIDNSGEGSITVNSYSYGCNVRVANGEQLGILMYYDNDYNGYLLIKFNVLVNAWATGNELYCSFNDLDLDLNIETERTLLNAGYNEIAYIVNFTGTYLDEVHIYIDTVFTTSNADFVFSNMQLFDLTGAFGNNIPTIEEFNNMFPWSYYGIGDNEITINTYDTTTYTMSITDSMSTAWTNTWSNPLFSWSANGFLIAPFNYITNLFGMPNNSTFSLALNYWLTISIVYLVFDLVMYVPLLAHRWIDKGMVE